MMKNAFFLFLALVFCTSLMAFDQAPQLPQNPRNWLDSKKANFHELQGKVVLLNVWTFACWNSYRSLPWLVSLQSKFPDLQLIGVHSPEFDYEKNRKLMRDVMERYHVTYPQLLDDNHDYWNSLDNSYWPAFYIVDKRGKIRGKFAGETHPEDAQAAQIEKLIEILRKEK